MKTTILGLLIFLSGSLAQAASWVEIRPNHGNPVYSEGEVAKFYVRAAVQPSNPDFKLKVTVEFLGEMAPVEIPLAGGYGEYQSPPLAAGQQSFRFVTSLIGPSTPPDLPFERELESKTWPLTVIELE